MNIVQVDSRDAELGHFASVNEEIIRSPNILFKHLIVKLRILSEKTIY